MSNLEDRFQAIMSKSNQIESDKNLRKKVENNLFDINDALKDVAGRIEDCVRDLIFIDLDSFLHGQSFASHANNNNGRDYKLNNKQIEWLPISASSRKIAFLVKQNIIESKDHRVEVSFKDPIVVSGMKVATQGMTITSNQSTEELSDWLRQLEAIKHKLDTQLTGLSLNDISFEVFLVSSNHRAKKVMTPREVMLAILES